MPYTGPATIVGKVGTDGREVVYKIRSRRGRDRVVHHNHLKPVVGSKRKAGDKPTVPVCAGNDDKMTSNVPAPLMKCSDVQTTGNGDGLELKEDEIALLMMKAGAKHHDQNSIELTPRAPYITRSGRVSKPVQRYEAGGS